MFLDKRQPDGVERNQESSFVLVTLQLLFGLHSVRLKELREVGASGLMWAPGAAPQPNHGSLHAVASFDSKIGMIKSRVTVGSNRSGRRSPIV